MYNFYYLPSREVVNVLFDNTENWALRYFVHLGTFTNISTPIDCIDLLYRKLGESLKLIMFLRVLL